MEESGKRYLINALQTKMGDAQGEGLVAMQPAYIKAVDWYAKKEFYKSFVSLKAQIPLFTRDATVKFRGYKYTKLDTIITKLRPIMKDYGFAYQYVGSKHVGITLQVDKTTKIDNNDPLIKALQDVISSMGEMPVAEKMDMCTKYIEARKLYRDTVTSSSPAYVVRFSARLIHKKGHTEDYHFEYPLKFGNNPIQDEGALDTYAKRYILLAILGETATDDTDASDPDYTQKGSNQYAPKKKPNDARNADPREEGSHQLGD